MNKSGITIDDLYKKADMDSNVLKDPDVAYLVINRNKVLGLKGIPGLNIDTEELEDGVKALITVDDNTIIKKDVHLCFGMLSKEGTQRIITKTIVGKNSRISILSHCVFTTAVNIRHIMEGEIEVGENSEYTYMEKHIHGKSGGVKVYPHAKVILKKNARFKTEFDLIKGRAGYLDIDYDIEGDEKSIMEMTSKVNAYGDDVIKISEKGHLKGEGSKGFLNSRIAVRENAKAEVYNKIKADAPYCVGHVDCKELIQDNGVATAIPIVEVTNPKARVTHEAAIGSVDSKQLQTLMSRGLSEEEATDVIIQGILS